MLELWYNLFMDYSLEEQELNNSTAHKPQALIEVTGLTKRFSDLTAVDNICFDVLSGELFGFLGPNGAGKTTTINILSGLSNPDLGTIRIAGLDLTGNSRAAQHLIGVVPDESNLYPELSGFDNLCFCASLYGMRKNQRQKRARELLEIFGLSDAAYRKFAGYSKGMKRKLTIAAGIIHEPLILFLDEPTTGIDVVSARQVRQLIAELKQMGTTIFLTTHYIEEAEKLCDRIVFIVKGQIVMIDTIKNLLKPVRDKQVMMISIINPGNDLYDKLALSFPQYEFQNIYTKVVRVESAEPIKLGPLVRFIEDQGSEVVEAYQKKRSLEEIFIQVTGIELNAMKKEKEKKGGRWRSDKLIHIYSFKVSRWLTALTVDSMFNRWWALGKWRWVRIFVKSQETLLYQPF
jgi:ABC-2 type transport system ATP-binding protein